MGRKIVGVLLILLLSVAIPTVAAHSPTFEEGGGELGNATTIENPTKSWVIYTHLHEEGEVQYYRMEMSEGERIYVMLSVPKPEGDRGFTPSMALMGPGIDGNATLPPLVERPADVGVEVEEGRVPDELTYEPFSPSVFYEVSNFSVEAPQDGTYYLAVYSQEGSGNYALAVGQRESFTLVEWLLIPINLIRVYEWEGQEWWLIAVPGILSFVAGAIVMTVASRRRLHRPDRLWLLATVAGLLMLASGATLLFQMMLSLYLLGELAVGAVVTLIFSILPLALGVAALRVAHRERGLYGVGWKQKGGLIAIGLLGLAFWAGWVVGPALAIATGLVPRNWLNRTLRK